MPEQSTSCASKSESCAGKRCGRCCGGACADDAAGISLTPDESAFLAALSQYAFLPAAFAPSPGGPICLEVEGMTLETAAAALSALQEKHLISVDYDLPLVNFDYSAYAAFERNGSIALTALGQQAADQI